MAFRLNTNKGEAGSHDLKKILPTFDSSIFPSSAINQVHNSIKCRNKERKGDVLDLYKSNMPLLSSAGLRFGLF